MEVTETPLLPTVKAYTSNSEVVGGSNVTIGCSIKYWHFIISIVLPRWQNRNMSKILQPDYTKYVIYDS
jgi:hypothetical protein